MFIEPHVIISTAVTTFENRKVLGELCKNLWQQITTGRIPIVVFGPGGVGKTTLGYFLEKPGERLLSMAKYDRSIETETFNVGGPLLATVYVPPGQQFRRASTWPELYTMLAQASQMLVLNVVSDGYHVLSLEPEILSAFASPGAKRKDILEDFLVRRRRKELEVVRAITEHMCKIQTRISMITVVTKQDLWWERRDQVKKHYEQGTYSRFLDNVQKAKGAQSFHHEYVSLSLVANNLCTDAGEIAYPTARGYDEIIQVAHQKNFVQTLHALIKVS